MPPRTAKFIWNDPHGQGRNRYVLFRKSFNLVDQPAEALLHLFADTRYRLIVNGRTVAHGPARFFVVKPEYDTHDLLPFLRKGRNVIAIIVNSYGCVSFHSEVSIGGLIAWGAFADASGNTIQLATDESWRALESPGHRRETAHLSFALNAGEFLDAREMPAGWDLPDFDDSHWPSAVAHGDPRHWGQLQSRSIPLLDERAILPRRQLGTFIAGGRDNEDVYSLMLIAAGGRSLHTRARVALMTFLHSPHPQQIAFGAWWGRYWLNGDEIKATAKHNDHLRQDFRATLHQGWNTLLVYERVNQAWWDFYLALPKSAGITVAAEPRPDCPDAFLIGGLWEDALADIADRMPLPLAGPDDLPAELRPVGALAPQPIGQHPLPPAHLEDLSAHHR